VVRVRQHEARVTRGKACCGRQLDKGRARSGRRCGWPGHGDSVRVGPGAANSERRREVLVNWCIDDGAGFLSFGLVPVPNPVLS
jgi:hypothetical protein